MPSARTAVSTAQFLTHWQGHRRLTRRTIEAFPEDQLFTFSISGMRSFGEMINELIGLGVPMVRGVLTSEWQPFADTKITDREELLKQWDAQTAELDELFPQIDPAKFSETMTVFDSYTSELWDLLIYAIDNEIHHRAQGFVYLRALGVKPPDFYER